MKYCGWKLDICLSDVVSWMGWLGINPSYRHTFVHTYFDTSVNLWHLIVSCIYDIIYRLCESTWKNCVEKNRRVLDMLSIDVGLFYMSSDSRLCFEQQFWGRRNGLHLWRWINISVCKSSTWGYKLQLCHISLFIQEKKRHFSIWWNTITPNHFSIIYVILLN